MRARAYVIHITLLSSAWHWCHRRWDDKATHVMHGTYNMRFWTKFFIYFDFEAEHQISDTKRQTCFFTSLLLNSCQSTFSGDDFCLDFQLEILIEIILFEYPFQATLTVLSKCTFCRPLSHYLFFWFVFSEVPLFVSCV